MASDPRIELLRSIVKADGFGLEIGPSHNPIFPKSEGFNVETLDWADADRLRRHYEELGVDSARIEHVDYVSDGRPFDEIIDRRGQYDFVFSSHVIEHVTDILGYLKSCEALLKPDGVIALAVPDKRYTFDLFQPISTVGEVLEAHGRRHTRHRASAVYDFVTNFALFDEREVFSKTETGALRLPHEIAGAKALLDQIISDDPTYHDVHGWVFTPSSFRLILHDLKTLGLIEVEEFHLYEVGALEFHVGLSRTAEGNGLSRLDLLKDMMREQVESSAQLLAHDDPRYRRLLGIGDRADPPEAEAKTTRASWLKRLSNALR